jgi:hypothetical protein
MEKIRIRDPGWKKYGSGINIPDPQHCCSVLMLLGDNRDNSKQILEMTVKKRAVPVCHNFFNSPYHRFSYVI